MKEQIYVVSAVRDRICYAKCVANNKFLLADNVSFVAYDNNTANIPIPIRYNDFIQKHGSENAWCVFCHEDFEFLQPIRSVMCASLDRDTIYGVAGADVSGLIWGNLINCSRDGAHRSLLEHRTMEIKYVSTVDCCCLIFHLSLARRFSLRFDEELSWDLYAEDFSVLAREHYNIRTSVVPLLCRHWSYGLKGKTFAQSLYYLRLKWRTSSRLYHTTTLECVGARWRVLSFHLWRKFFKFVWNRRFISRQEIKTSLCRIPIWHEHVCWRPSMAYVSCYSTEDQFYDLLYTSVYLSSKVSSDAYRDCVALGDQLGYESNFDKYLSKLVPHLRSCWRRVHWSIPTFEYYNVTNAEWLSLSKKVSQDFQVFDLRPFRISSWNEPERRMSELLLEGMLRRAPVVVKFSREVARTLENEYRMLKRFNNAHPAFCPKPIGCGQCNGGMYILESLFYGEPLNVFLASNKDPNMILMVAKRLLRTVCALNDLKILHRDLRPENVLVDVDGNVCVIDFQFALDLSQGYEELSFCSHRTDVLMSIGAEYRAGVNEFCDMVSLRRLLDLFPSSAALDAIRRNVDVLVMSHPLRIDLREKHCNVLA